jgi:hypothetical protein
MSRERNKFLLLPSTDSWTYVDIPISDENRQKNMMTISGTFNGPRSIQQSVLVSLDIQEAPSKLQSKSRRETQR